jgi:hypothetical protein
MFIGHYGLGFFAKRVMPTLSLGVLFAACQLADLVWPTLVLLGIERVEIDPGNTAVTPLAFVYYPYSHSLVALAAWGAAAGAGYSLICRSGPSAAVTIGALVASHWLLDWISHRADMPLTMTGTARVGLGLWRSVPGTVLVEGSIFAIGVAVYVAVTRARDRIGSIGGWALIGVLAGVYVLNLAGPPPPSGAAVAWAAEAMWLLVLWAYWIDGHRVDHRS